MRKMTTILALILAVSFLLPAVSSAGGYDRYSRNHHYRNPGPSPSLFIAAALMVGAVIGGFQNAPAYWGDPNYRKNPGAGYSNYEREYWSEDSQGNRYWTRDGGSYRTYSGD
jgi:hypothetical protein